MLRDIGRAVIPCNWLQIMENSVDPVHLEWLHGHHLSAVRRRLGLTAPTHCPRRHVEIGFDCFPYGIIERRVLEGGSREDDDWQVGHPLVFPNMVGVGAHRQHRLQIRVPVDDTDEADVKTMVEHAVTRFGWLDCLLNGCARRVHPDAAQGP